MEPFRITNTHSEDGMAVYLTVNVATHNSLRAFIMSMKIEQRKEKKSSFYRDMVDHPNVVLSKSISHSFQ